MEAITPPCCDLFRAIKLATLEAATPSALAPLLRGRLFSTRVQSYLNSLKAGQHKSALLGGTSSREAKHPSFFLGRRLSPACEKSCCPRHLANDDGYLFSLIRHWLTYSCFGALKYPLTLFLSTVNTTTS